MNVVMKPFIHNLVFPKFRKTLSCKIDYIYLSGSDIHLCLVSISGETFSLEIILANFTVNALLTFSFVRAMKFR